MSETPGHTDSTFMRRAFELAAQAARAGEVPVGAVVVLDGLIVGEGYNRPISTHDPTGHAEVVALRAAAAKLGNYRIPGAAIYVSLEPCIMCAGAIMHARIARLIYGAPDAKTGACGGVVDLFAQTRLNHHATVTGGVMAEEAVALLQRFFASRRAQKRVE